MTATKKPASSPHTHWLAIRKEAEWWNAYYTCHENLLDAELIGAIQTQFVASPERKEAFRALMQEIVEDLIRQATGALPITESESET